MEWSSESQAHCGTRKWLMLDGAMFKKTFVCSLRKNIVSVIKYFAKRSLSFRGHRNESSYILDDRSVDHVRKRRENLKRKGFITLLGILTITINIGITQKETCERVRKSPCDRGTSLINFTKKLHYTLNYSWGKARFAHTHKRSPKYVKCRFWKICTENKTNLVLNTCDLGMYTKRTLYFQRTVHYFSFCDMGSLCTWHVYVKNWIM